MRIPRITPVDMLKLVRRFAGEIRRSYHLGYPSYLEDEYQILQLKHNLLSAEIDAQRWRSNAEEEVDRDYDIGEYIATLHNRSRENEKDYLGMDSRIRELKRRKGLWPDRFIFEEALEDHDVTPPGEPDES